MNGKGKPINIDGNKIDITDLKIPASADFEGGEFRLETHQAFLQLLYETASTYGGSSVKCINGEWRILSQNYHYDYKTVGINKNFFRDSLRNIATYIGEPKLNLSFSLGNNGMASVPSIPIVPAKTP